MCSEIIEVSGTAPCPAGSEALGSGSCVRIDGGSGNGPTGHGGQGDHSSGGDTGGSHAGTTSHVGAGAKHRAICHACRTAGKQCVTQAVSAESICITNSAIVAQSRCESRGTTPWGCFVNDVWQKQCTGVEPNWAARDWKVGFYKDPDSGRIKFGGPGVLNCALAWSDPHTNGSTSTSDTGSVEYTVGFNAVIVSSDTFKYTRSKTEELSWTGQSGYELTCSNLGNKLSTDCAVMQQQCATDNQCSANDQ
jgi:hypothetical protein